MVISTRLNFDRMLMMELSRINMGKELMLEYPSFLEDIRLMDRVLQELEHAPSWSIEGIERMLLIKVIPLTKVQTSC